MNDQLAQVNGEAKGSYEIKGSHFLSFLVSYESFAQTLKILRENHPKAVHFVSASRHFNEYRQIVESSDDDREPKGSSGLPCLNVLRGEGLVNTGVIVVRYFGGTLLGVGGLVKAYTIAVQEAINDAKKQQILKPFIFLSHLILEVPYSKLSKIEYECCKCGLSLKKEAFLSSGVKVSIQGQEDVLNTLKAKLLS
ncbi:hypothetical protein LS68_004275 [Helicobacter sp. MIT 05-5293]|uniref:YigZ family protein n=1 Tax=Helicobacter sp. MIT 05-5293 TaxID=1548149 RepID=UPI00051D5212|nr:YigZ family protein [Helicobacter sp. MIT 05-5293]TLD82215.1 hypothetical protein LS68_004275 [Helicobacter sp. MIT 05-5293]